jgi:hydrogenase nickel incorporation protein HypA/HybF
MHELSICQNMIKQVNTITQEHGAKSVQSIQLQVGPLSGIDTALLEHAFPTASAGTIAEGAELIVEQLPVRIRCLSCNKESQVELNQLICPLCQHSQTQLLSGNEMLLRNVGLA